MKILIVNKFLYENGGSETYIFQLGKQLQKLGHEVQYFGMEHEKRGVGNQAESYTSNMDFHTGKMKKILYPFKIIYSKEARKKIRLVLDDFQPDIVHLNNFNFQLTPSILYEMDKYRKTCNRKMKIVFTAHDSQLVCPNHLMQQFISGERCMKCIEGSPWNCTRYRCIHGSIPKSLIGSLEAWIYRRFKTYELIDLVICPSEFIKEKLEFYPGLKNKTLVVHNFVENGVKKRIKNENVTSYILYFGRFSKEKGIETLINVCRELEQIPFIFAGNGPLENRIKSVSNINDIGFQTGEKLQEIIQNARFSVFPSECNENCPFTVMESIMYGTPVIGAAIGGVPELIQDGENGLLFESGNRQQLLEKIRCLWEDEKLLEKLNEGCERTVFYDVETYCEKLLYYYMDDSGR